MEGQQAGSAPDSLEARLSWLKGKLDDCSDLVTFPCMVGSEVRGLLIYIEGLTDLEGIQRSIMLPLLQNAALDRQSLHSALLEHRSLFGCPYTMQTQLADLVKSVLAGSAALLMEGIAPALLFPVRSPNSRTVSQPETETTIRGPKDSFIEDLQTNLALLRKRLVSANFRVDTYKIGSETSTNVAVVYMKNIAKPKLIDKVKSRMEAIDDVSLVGTSQIEEMIEDHKYSPFPQMVYTERPDVVASALLGGHVAIFVDGTPNPILAPATLLMFMQSAEDYYQRFFTSTIIRWIRVFFAVVSLLLPSTYVAITTFHPEMIPPLLLMTVAASREIVPFPALVEAFIMEISFEALREAGTRIPKTIGQTVTVVGALVIGQAAVQAGIVSAPMVIIVSMTGIASFILPHYELSLTMRWLRFPIMILAGVLGLYGVMIGVFLLYTHLLSLRPFGTPYLSPLIPLQSKGIRDSLVRAPWWFLKKSGGNHAPIDGDPEAGQEEGGGETAVRFL